MQDEELLQLLIDNEEWQRFESKRAAVQPARMLETMVAFANTEGGLIVLGLEDAKKAKGKARIIGISENVDNTSEVLKQIDKEIDPALRLWSFFELDTINTIGAKDKLLVINVQKSNEVHSLKRGDTFVRKGNQNVKIGSTEIIRLKYEKGSIRFEDEISGIITLDDLDLTLLHSYKKQTQSSTSDDWQFLKDNGLALAKDDRFVLTKAGVLLFGKNPAVVLKNKNSIKISHYYGTKITYTGEPNFVRRPFTIEGPLITQIELALAYFHEVASASPPRLKGATFKPSMLIPEWAYQEAITNAVIHRNYSIENDIQVRFFDDRIEIESPGSYPGHITVANIRTERFARNPLILRVLNRFQNAPNLDIGEGVDRIFTVMRSRNLYDPLYLPPSLRPNSVLVMLLNLRKIEYWDTVSNFLDEHYRISNVQARGITGISDTLKMSRLLSVWVNKGLLERIGKGYKGAMYYKKPGGEVR